MMKQGRKIHNGGMERGMHGPRHHEYDDVVIILCSQINRAHTCELRPVTGENPLELLGKGAGQKQPSKQWRVKSLLCSQWCMAAAHMWSEDGNQSIVGFLLVCFWFCCLEVLSHSSGQAWDELVRVGSPRMRLYWAGMQCKKTKRVENMSCLALNVNAK